MNRDLRIDAIAPSGHPGHKNLFAKSTRKSLGATDAPLAWIRVATTDGFMLRRLCSTKALTLLILALLFTQQAWAQPYELSYLVIRTRDGAVLWQQESEKLRTPASTLKLLTAASAMENLAPTHRFSTRLQSDTTPREQAIQNLYLLGDADPELTDQALKNFVLTLKKSGITRIYGNLFVDPGPYSFPPYGQGWAWDDAGHGYMSEIGGLSLESGAFPVGATDTEPWLEHQPQASPQGRWSVPGKHGLLVHGPLPGTVAPPQVHLRAGERLREELRQQGLEFSGRVLEGRGGKEKVTLGTHLSRELKDILKHALEVSDNLASELVYRANQQRLPEVLKQEQLKVVDGSGLSRYNLVSARHLVMVLQNSRKVFLEILPQAGEGTLKKRFLEGATSGRIKAKTGTLSSVSSLAGFLLPDTENECAFAILINGHLGTSLERKQLENQLVESWVASLESSEFSTSI